jgi:hypothetical protein
MLQAMEWLSHEPHLMRISFHIKLKFSPKMIWILIQCQMRRVGRTLWHIKHREPCIWSYLHGPRDFLLLLSPQQAALQAVHSQGEDTAGFKVYPVLERLDPKNPGMQQRFHEKILFKTLKAVKPASTMYGSAVPFMLGYYRVWQETVLCLQTTGHGWQKHASLQVITCCGKQAL